MVTWQGHTANYIDCALNKMWLSYGRIWQCICAWDQEDLSIYREVIRQRRDRILQSRTPLPTTTSTQTSAATPAFSFSQTGISSSRSFAELSADDWPLTLNGLGGFSFFLTKLSFQVSQKN